MLSDNCRQDGLSFAVKDLHTKFIFKFLNHRTQCWLGYFAGLCSLSEMLMSVYCDDIL